MTEIEIVIQKNIFQEKSIVIKGIYPEQLIDWLNGSKIHTTPLYANNDNDHRDTLYRCKDGSVQIHLEGGIIKLSAIDTVNIANVISNEHRSDRFKAW